MTTPTPAPAPMTAANPGNQSLGPSRYIEVDREKYDALTARVAELEAKLESERRDALAHAKAMAATADAILAQLKEPRHD